MPSASKRCYAVLRLINIREAFRSCEWIAGSDVLIIASRPTQETISILNESFVKAVNGLFRVSNDSAGTLSAVDIRRKSVRITFIDVEALTSSRTLRDFIVPSSFQINVVNTA